MKPTSETYSNNRSPLSDVSRWLLVGLAAITSAAITWAFASYFTDSLIVFSAIGSGWVLYFAISFLLLSDKIWMDLLSQTSIVMVRGVLIFGTSILIFPFGWISMIIVPIIICWAFIDMNLQMKKRVKRLKLSSNYYFLWLCCLCVTCGIILIPTIWTLLKHYL